MTPERYRRLRTTLDHRQPDLTVLMDGVHKLHNIAAIVRTCDAVGIGDVHAVLPRSRSRAPLRTAMGAQRWVHLHPHESESMAIHAARKQGMQVLAAHFSERARPYRDIDFTRPTALLLGTEKFGVSEATAATVDEHIVVPMMGMVESFNVSVAAAIILSEACEQRRRAGLYARVRLDSTRYNDLLFRWAHPRIAAHCTRFGVPFPALDARGDIVKAKAFNYRLSEAILQHESLA